MQEDQGQRFAALPPEQAGRAVTERWYLPPQLPSSAQAAQGVSSGALLPAKQTSRAADGWRWQPLSAEGGRRWCRQGEGAATEEGAQALLPFNPPTPQPAALCYLHAFPSFCPCLQGAKIQLSFPCWALLGQLSTTLHRVLGDTHVVNVCSQGRRWRGTSMWSVCQRS